LRQGALARLSSGNYDVIGLFDFFGQSSIFQLSVRGDSRRELSMNRSMVIGAGLLLGLALGSANAQEAVLAELYGQGVHAYYSRDLQTAHELLSSAIDQGSHDPRCYYFRGLTYSSLGRPDEAEADFKKGAQFEVTASDRVYPVADSLQRVQGKPRLQIEKHRRIARLTYHAKASEIQKARYEQMKRSEQEVVRDPSRKAASQPAPTEGVAPAAEKSDPFAADTEMKPEKAPERPAEPAVTAPAEADPFGAPAAAAPAAPGTATPAPASDETTNPFTDDKPAAEAAPAAPATPAPATPSAEADDPFK
jgi:tetratricopeptide (TPR) repeat protein